MHLIKLFENTGKSGHLHTPRVITRSLDNRMVWRWDNADPFGMSQPDENPDKLGTFTYNSRFPGQVFDRETNNHYNYFRDYDPQQGRYVQSDPIGLEGGINTYGYALANPVTNTDPKGLFVPLVIAGVCAGGGCEALFVAAVAGSGWWASQQAPKGSGGRISPDESFLPGITWPPKSEPTQGYVEQPPIKPPVPPKGNCEEALAQCRSVAASGQSIVIRGGAYVMRVAMYMTCKKMFGGDK